MNETIARKPTIKELEAMLERDDTKVTILPNGEVRVLGQVTVKALEEMVICAIRSFFAELHPDAKLDIERDDC